MRTKHGYSRKGKVAPEWTAWSSMRNRCFNKKHKSYFRYGGRGISVCGRWLGENGFANFIADMGNKPSPKHTLDRFPNNDGNYEPSNCRWATPKEQCNNRSNNVILTRNGESLTVSQWANRFNITPNSLTIYLMTHSFEDAYDYYSNHPDERLKILNKRRLRTGSKNKKPVIRFDLTGKRFTDLVVIKFHGQSKKGSVWECRCECGKTKLITTGNLHDGRNKSCGCQEKKRKYAH